MSDLEPDSQALVDDVRDAAGLSPEQLAIEKLRHSAAHVMAQAVRRRWPGTRLAIGPTIQDGFYYDLDVPAALGPDDLPAIEAEMRRIVDADLPLERESWDKEKARAFFADEPYKLEIIDRIPGEQVSTYRQGEFTDLCNGPHLERTGQLRHFKLTSVAGAYWRGDEKLPQLTRLYGTAFATAAELALHLERLEQARLRDHRRLGRELGLFSFHPEAPAMPFFHPKGAIVYNLLIEYVRGLYLEFGYQEVVTPQVFDTSLWRRSGHLDHFAQNMFMVDVDGRQFGIKPMNCPAHCLMFGESLWSYRDLPVRFADFGRLHRYERSGATHGLTRVRSMAQDDAHVFCAPEQVAAEVASVLKMIERAYRDLDLGLPQVFLATRPAQSLGEAATWERAEAALREALAVSGMEYQVEAGEGAFYGPKIDFFFRDALDRPWQLSTIQLDFNLPERFDLGYVTAAGKSERPVMIHRAVLGTLERFLGVLIEHHAGALPPWLAPEQARVLPITDGQAEAAESVRDRLVARGLRATVDRRSEKLGRKVRDAQLQKVPWQLVIGGREAEADSVSVRLLRGGDQGVMPVDRFADEAVRQVAERSPLPTATGAAPAA